MSVILVVLLMLSALLAFAALLLPRVPRFRQRFPAARTARAVGFAQIVLGGLWMLWGIVYLRIGASAAVGGWYAILLGALWSLQGARRVRRLGRRRR